MSLCASDVLIRQRACRRAWSYLREMSGPTSTEALLGDRCDHHRLGRPRCLAMKDRLDVVAVGVQREGGVVPGVIRPFTGRTVVAAARSERCRMEGGDGGAIGCLESKMNARHRSVRLVHEQPVDVEVAAALDQAARSPEG